MGNDYEYIIEQLIGTLSLSNMNWNSWELEFIEGMEDKRQNELSPKQKKVLDRLWEKV